MSVNTRTSTTMTPNEREPLAEGENYMACTMDLMAEMQKGKYKIETGNNAIYLNSDKLEIVIPAESNELAKPNTVGEYSAGGMDK